MANCRNCAKVLDATTQSQMALLLGVYLCQQCWMDEFCGNDRSQGMSNIATLGEDGKVLAEQLPTGTGGLTIDDVKADEDIASALSLKHSNSLDHSNTHDSSPHAPSNAQVNADITKAEIEAKLTGEILSHSHAGGGGELETVVVKVGDTANATVNMADATGLSFTAEANKLYIIEAWIVYNTNATTVGIKLSASAPSSPTFIAGQWLTNAANGTLDGAAFNANDVTVTTTAAPFTTNNHAILFCSFYNGANQGTWVVRFAAETTGTITIKDGSSLRYRKLN